MTGNADSQRFYQVVGENIKKFREIRNFSLQILAEKVGVTKKTIQRYEQGEIKIDMNRLADIAEALNVETAQLIVGAETFFGAELYDGAVAYLPVAGAISCGNGVTAIQDVDEYVETPRSWLSSGDYFYLRAKGDSMINARIFEGDLLLIRQQSDVHDGEIAAVLIDEEAVLKRVYKRNGTVVLQSENPKYHPIVLVEGEHHNIQIVGKLVKIIVNI